jgi:LmbE family N-acetylglucosaminyl deacetylase
MADPRPSVLVIAAHPDDEVLGCGGTIALHRRAGHRVTVCIAASGRPAARDGTPAQNAFATAAMEVLGVTDLRLLGFPDQRLDTLCLVDIITPLEVIVREVQPRIVYCQWGGDINRDHEILFQATLVATRPTEPSIDAVYAFDTASSTEWAYPRSFRPDTWVDISTTLELKLRAMQEYRSELREFPHPRSIQGLRHRAAAHGGACCIAGAEVFMTVRRIARDGQTPL